MEINDNGINPITYEDIKSDIENSLKNLYGEDFYIKENGIIDAFVKIIFDMELRFQEILTDVVKIFNTDTVFGLWQDALYERISVKRLDAKKTTFTIGIISDGEASVKAGGIRLQTNSGAKEFVNISDFVSNAGGYTKVDFISTEYGDVEITHNDEFKIISAPVVITDVDNSSIQNIEIGKVRESDEDFRNRFRTSKAINSKATHFANISNLVQYVDNENYLQIIDKKFDNSYSPMTVMVIAKHNTTDHIFAEQIFESFGAGIEFWGDTEINIRDIKGKNIPVKFQKAEDINVNVKIDIEPDSGVYLSEIYQNVKGNIMSYVAEKGYGLGSTLYATELIIPIYNTDGVRTVNSVEIKKENDNTYVDIINFGIAEIPAFSVENIVFAEGV